MNKLSKYLCLGAFGLGLWSCSSEEPVKDPGTNNDGQTRTSYMAVNLMSADDATRASAGYEDGTPIENKVSNVRFYFFTESGSPANVKYLEGSYVNFYDWTKDLGQEQTGSSDDYIESTLQATIVINTKEGDKVPQRIVAVINPTTSDDVLGNTSKSLNDLKSIYRDYSTAALTTEGKFVMFNAVRSEENAQLSTTLITADNLCKSTEDALANPVTIKVERNVAKVRTRMHGDLPFVDDKLALTDGDKNIEVDGQQVYLKINGWDLTAEANRTRLVKMVDPTWTGNWWNGVDRSFWAKNAPNATNRYFDYNAINNALTSSLYTNENAEDFNSESPIKRTKVILSGTLCKADGSPFTIVRHLGAYFADTPSPKGEGFDESENLKLLKKSILNQLNANGMKYFYDEGENERKQIDVNDLKIVVASQLQQEESKNNCYVYAQLSDAAKEKTWYNSDEKAAEAIDDGVIDAALKNKEIVDWALVWNEGMTYYYYEILHKGIGTPVVSQSGVVRNHIYDTRVTKIVGLGTPVYDPSKVIYPEKPSPNEHYIAAEIDILSWRVVQENYELEW